MKTLKAVAVAALLMPGIAHAQSVAEMPFDFSGTIHITVDAVEEDNGCPVSGSYALPSNFVEQAKGIPYYIGATCANYNARSIFFWFYHPVIPTGSWTAYAYNVDCIQQTLQRIRYTTGTTEAELVRNTVPLSTIPWMLGNLPPADAARMLCFNRGFWR